MTSNGPNSRSIPERNGGGDRPGAASRDALPKSSGRSLVKADRGQIQLTLPVAQSMDKTGGYEMRAGDEPHERTQARCSQGTREEKTGHIGFKVVIQYRGTAHHLEIGAQRRRDVIEESQIKAEASSGDDVIRALGHHALGGSQVEANTVAYCFSSEYLVTKQHRHFSFDPGAKPPCALRTQEAQAPVQPTFLGQEPKDVR